MRAVASRALIDPTSLEWAGGMPRRWRASSHKQSIPKIDHAGPFDSTENQFQSTEWSIGGLFSDILILIGQIRLACEIGRNPSSRNPYIFSAHTSVHPAANRVNQKQRHSKGKVLGTEEAVQASPIHSPLFLVWLFLSVLCFCAAARLSSFLLRGGPKNGVLCKRTRRAHNHPPKPTLPIRLQRLGPGLLLLWVCLESGTAGMAVSLHGSRYGQIHQHTNNVCACLPAHKSPRPNQPNPISSLYKALLHRI